MSIQTKITGRDVYGAEIITWVNYANVWASIEPLSGREYFLAQQMQAIVDHKITMRFQSGIRPDMRATWNNRGFDIKAVINKDERDIELILMCSEFVLKVPEETTGTITTPVTLGEGLGLGPLGEGPLGG